MSLPQTDDENLRDLTLQTFTGSALFERTFDEGMSLVEETARYLDGRGRQESRDLPRKEALLYAGESMRVTTRLMQAASWLLIQRAVHDGDMPIEDAAGEVRALVRVGDGDVGHLLPRLIRDPRHEFDDLELGKCALLAIDQVEECE